MYGKFDPLSTQPICCLYVTHEIKLWLMTKLEISIQAILDKLYTTASYFKKKTFILIVKMNTSLTYMEPFFHELAFKIIWKVILKIIEGFIKWNSTYNFKPHINPFLSSGDHIFFKANNMFMKAYAFAIWFSKRRIKKKTIYFQNS